MPVLVDGLATRERGDPVEAGILLWPGLGATGAYFDSITEELPGRTVAVDPPGSGRSPPAEPWTYERLVEQTRTVFDATGCRATIGHSLGAWISLGLAVEPPPALEAVVLIDGGFMSPQEMASSGMPVTSERAELISFLAADPMDFADWDTAVREAAALFGGEPTPALRAYLHQIFAFRDGQIRELGDPEASADLLKAVFDDDHSSGAEDIAVPTLLIACGQPAERRPVREEAWKRFARASPLVELQVADGWSHNPIFQDRAGLAAAITGWLDEHVERW